MKLNKNLIIINHKIKIKIKLKIKIKNKILYINNKNSIIKKIKFKIMKS